MKQKKIGIIGFGSIGKHLGQELQDVAGGLAKITDVYEPSDQRYQQSSDFMGHKPTRFDRISKMLEQNLDGIIISSPNHCHLENLTELKGSVLPILLEKPLDASFETICDVVRFSESYEAPIVVDHVMRYVPIVAKAKELIVSGAIGKICSASFVQNCFYGNYMYHCFRRTMAGGGGMFIEKATHDFDIMMYLMESKPIKVSAVARQQAYGGDKPDDLRCRNCDERLSCDESVNNIHQRNSADATVIKEADDLCVYAKEIDVPDNEVCLIELENGMFGTYTQCFFAPSGYTTREYELVGLDGIMKISFSLIGSHDKGRIVVCKRFGAPEVSTTFDFDYQGRIHYNGGGAVAKHFCNVIDKTEEPFTTVRQAFLAEILGYSATLAAQKGEFVYPEKVLPENLRSIWSQL
jgi:predicted dehydrogenase